MFVFGDSLTDNGNNNFLDSLAKSDYYPYGIDFFQGPTGRFSNGQTIIDAMCDVLGLKYLPAHASPGLNGSKLLGGCNYASAAGGILDISGMYLGERYSLKQQVLNFEQNLNEIKAFLGLRKFLLAGVGPLGCIPNQRASSMGPPDRCVDQVNQVVGYFNSGLRSLVEQLNTNHPGSIFLYGNTYDALGDMLNNPAKYGLTVIDRGCCGIGRNQGQITCLPLAVPCLEREKYIFWDAYHPTQAVNMMLAKRAYDGLPSDIYPINLRQLAQL
ncbi:hypothetical protein LUZ60_007665 [Juncus effusus]|nr:hypothetical protein LUZ60_007665 [Juncus effusus]